MAQNPQDGPLPPSLRFLKGLVIILMLTMIGGLIALVALFVTRLPLAANGPQIPQSLQMPEGERPSAVTFAGKWTAVVTQSDRILIFDQAGELVKEVSLDP